MRGFFTHCDREALRSFRTEREFSESATGRHVSPRSSPGSGRDVARGADVRNPPEVCIAGAQQGLDLGVAD